MTLPRLYLKQGREKPVLNGHPWIFSGGVKSIEGNPQPGDIIDIRAHDGRFLARAYWNPSSQIQARILTWDDEPINDDWWRKMLQQAVTARAAYNRQTGIGYRVVHAESDYLPGLIVDRYDRFLVLQALTLGIDRHKHLIADILATQLDIDGIYERSDADSRRKEGLGIRNAHIWGKEPPEQIIITEANNVKISVDVYNGHKTGFYLDQARNRAQLTDLIRVEMGGKAHVLNLFSYTGGFGLHALTLPDVEITNVDASLDALELGEANVALNGFTAERAEHLQADVFEYLRDMADADMSYDVIVLDPPKFANGKNQVDSAARGYKDINMNAFALVKPGGYLMTYSCSGAISPDLFQKIVFGALVDSGRQAQIVGRLSASDDHPIALTFPEGEYLKGLLLRVY
ncbi:MAG: LSU m5C1962 methyltransferase RlmI [Chloroflexi bacterium AL-W]|nr:LSU m5C1962 methyltransferase RlmI [Chloroflexi bacterium AL-W]